MTHPQQQGSPEPRRPGEDRPRDPPAQPLHDDALVRGTQSDDDEAADVERQSATAPEQQPKDDVLFDENESGR